MIRSVFCISLGLALLAPLGCRTERPASTAQADAAHLAALAATPVGPSPVRHIDDARLVIARCGTPVSDQVMSYYNKMQNGPLRRMTYSNGQTVTLDFIPADPLAHTTSAGAMVQQPRTSQVSTHAVWRFDEAYVQQQQMLTARRLAFYLPCAAAALYPED